MSYDPTVIQTALVRLDRRRDIRDRRRFQLQRELYVRNPRLREVDAALRRTMADRGAAKRAHAPFDGVGMLSE